MEKKRKIVIMLMIALILGSFMSLSLVIAGSEGTAETMWDNLGGSDYPCCWRDSAGDAFWVYSGSGLSPVDPNDCYKEIVSPSCLGDNGCCNTGYTCDQPTDKCVSSLITDCGDYKNPIDCNSDSSNVAEDSVDAKTGDSGYCSGAGVVIVGWEAGGGVWCENSTNSCRCEWKNGVCTSDYNITKFCDDGTEDPVGFCSFGVSELTNCSGGYRLMKWTATWAPGTKPEEASCEDGQKMVPCPAQLSFTSLMGLAIAVILVVVFYLLSLRKKEGVRKKVEIRKKRR